MRSSLARHGLTLVEMLIAMGITLLIMASVIVLFDQVVDSISANRARLELGDRIRLTRNLLQQDLSRVTCPTVPWIDPNHGLGYFEYIEGPRSDFSAADVRIDSDFPPYNSVSHKASLEAYDSSKGYAQIQLNYPSSWGADLGMSLMIRNAINPQNNLETTITGFGPDHRFRVAAQELVDEAHSGAQPISLEFCSYTNVSNLGDFDDVLMFTARSNGAPYIGRFAPTAPSTPESSIESQVAEICWYMLVDGTNRRRSIRRRVLLVAPELQATFESDPVLKNDIDLRVPPIRRLHDFQLRYDLSARVEGDKIVLNTLGDLTKRENRYKHTSFKLGPIDSSTGESTPRYVPAPGKFPFPAMLATAPFDFDSGRQGEDVVMGDALGFDVLVFDPEANIFGKSNVGLDPSDEYFFSSANTANEQGNGAFVDLCYSSHSYNRIPQIWKDKANAGSLRGRSVFSAMPAKKSGFARGNNGVDDAYQFSYFGDANDRGLVIFDVDFVGSFHVGFEEQLFTQGGCHFDRISDAYRDTQIKRHAYLGIGPCYDTWSTHYEYDRVNQENGLMVTWATGQEEYDGGVNGLDEDNQNGTDDIDERETSPPYPVPLRAVKVVIRGHDARTGAVQQTSVIQSFSP